MSIFQYFSKDANKRAKYIFNTIAPVYAKVDHSLEKSYLRSMDLLSEEIDITGKTILDIGTGTGAWAAMFLDKASSVHGIDFSDKMLAVSTKKHPKIHFSEGNAEHLENIPDQSFDILTASFVLHGVTSDRRNKILLEMLRVSKEAIIIHDFVGKTPLFIRLLEFMEQSDYKNFKKQFYNELSEISQWQTKVIPSRDGSGLYIAKK